MKTQVEQAMSIGQAAAIAGNGRAFPRLVAISDDLPHARATKHNGEYEISDRATRILFTLKNETEASVGYPSTKSRSNVSIEDLPDKIKQLVAEAWAIAGLSASEDSVEQSPLRQLVNAELGRNTIAPAILEEMRYSGYSEPDAV